MGIESWVGWIIALEVAVVLGTTVFIARKFLGNARSDRNRDDLLDEARTVLDACLSGQKISSFDIEYLGGLPLRLKIDVFTEFESQITKSNRSLAHGLADKIGLLEDASDLIQSRKWYNRLDGSRLHSLFDSGEYVMPMRLLDESPYVRVQAIRWVSDHPNDLTIERLLLMLSDSSRLCRLSAKDALLHIGKPVLPHLDEFLNEINDDDTLQTCLEIGVQLSSPKLAHHANNFTGHHSWKIRLAAAKMLGAIATDESVEPLTRLLSDEHPEVRTLAAKQMGKLQQWEAAPNLARLLADSDETVRNESALALAALGAPGLLYLRRAYRDGENAAFEAADQALASLKDEYQATKRGST